MRTHAPSIRSAVWLLLLALPAAGADYYVDASAGSNTSGTGSRLAPWRTITHALTKIPPAVPPASHTLHVKGLFETRMGESFPITLPPGLRLVGLGPGKSILFGDGKTGVALLRFGAGVDLRSEVTGLGLHDGDPAVLVPAQAGAGAGPVIRSCRLAYNKRAIRIVGPARGTRAPVIEHCEILSGTILGVELVGSSGGAVGGRINACRIDYNRGVGLAVSAAAGPVQAAVTNCTMIRNTGAGIRFQGTNASTALFAHVTARANGGAGFEVVSGAGTAGLRIRNGIFHGQKFDLLNVPATIVTHCCFVTTSGPNPPKGRTNGNIQADPRFQTPGEPGLSPFSPVIDQAAFNPALDPATDIDGDRRNADGNGDARHGPDMGADEYMPLYPSGPAPFPGGINSLNVDLPSNASIPYYVGMAFSDTGVPVAGSRMIPLWPDALLALTLNSQLPFLEKFIGVMNSSGFGRATIHWPDDRRLKGLTFHTAAITLQPGYPGGVRCVTNGVPFTLL